MGGRVWFPVLFLIAFVFLVVYGSVNLSSSTMRFPWLVGGVVIALLMWQVVMEIRTHKEQEEEEEGEEDSLPLRSYIAGLGWYVAVFPAVYLLGFLVAAPLYVFCALKLRGESWWLSVLLASATGVFFYFGLHVALKVPLHEGVLWW